MQTSHLAVHKMQNSVFVKFNPSPALGSFDLELRRGVRADPPSISHESAVNLYFLIVGCNYLVSLIILSFVSRF